MTMYTIHLQSIPSIAKVPNLNVTKWPKCSFCFDHHCLLFFFKWASSKLCDSFMVVLHKTTAFYTEQCTSSSLFHNFEKSQKVLETRHSRTMASFVIPFSSLVHIHTKNLAMKEYHQCAWRHRELALCKSMLIQ